MARSRKASFARTRGVPADRLVETMLGPAADAVGRRMRGRVEEVGRLVHDMRVQAGLTQAQLAAALGVSQPRISEIERGAGIYGPSVSLLGEIAEACGCDFNIRAVPKWSTDAPQGVRSFALHKS